MLKIENVQVLMIKIVRIPERNSASIDDNKGTYFKTVCNYYHQHKHEYSYAYLGNIHL